MIEISHAIDVLNTLRKPMLHQTPVAGVVAMSKIRHIEAALTAENSLYITGSTAIDWLKFNFRVTRTAPGTPQSNILTAGAQPKSFHQGFLLYADHVLNFLDGQVPSRIVGHSLGAAAAQILGRALNVPTIALASPQVIKRPQSMRLKGEDKVLNIVWKEDLVTEGLKPLGYRDIGHTVELYGTRAHLGVDHFVKHYAKLVRADRACARPSLPKTWPGKIPVPKPRPARG